MSLKSAKEPGGFLTVQRAFYIILFMLLLLVGGVGGVYVWLKADNLRLVKQQEETEKARLQAELDRKQAEDVAKKTLARSRQEEALVVVRNATNSLEKLLGSMRQMTTDAASFRTNELGRKLASFPDLVGQARHLFDTEFRSLPTENEAITRLEGARRIELDLVSKIGGTYEPGADLLSANHATTAWAEEAQRRVLLAQTSLAALITEARVKVTSGTSPVGSLDEAIRQLSEGEALLRRQAMAAALASARKEADKKLTSALESQIKTEAEVKAALLAQQDVEAKAKLDREVQERQAQQRLADTQSKLGVSGTDNEARKLVLKRKAEDPRIQAKLAPFTTPGYLTAKEKLSVDKLPISYTELKSIGALEPTIAGIQRMVLVAYVGKDKDRPRWRFQHMDAASWKRVPSEMEQVKEVQALLIELGPVLVEMGKLAP